MKRVDLRKFLLNVRSKLLPFYRFGFAINIFLRYNPYTGFLGRKLYPYLPFLFPHDKSYYGFMHLAKKEHGLFVDIGANDGISALGFRHINKDYSILSIEPNPCHEAPLLRLKKNLRRFDYLIAAAGSENTEIDLQIPLYKGVPIHSAASFYKDYILDSMTKQFPDHTKGTVVCLKHTAKVIRIDDLNLTPDIIKIDTEGFEYNVLLGMTKTIETHKPYIMVEYCPGGNAKIEEFFKERDYQLFSYDTSRKRFNRFDPDKDPSSYKKKSFPGNLFCIPSPKTGSLPV